MERQHAAPRQPQAPRKALATKARRNDYGLVNAPSDWLSIQFSSPILPGMNSINTAINAAPDQVRRFILENQPVRGYWVELESAWQALRAHQQYTPAVQNLLGEAVSASVLLAASLKFEGTLTLQLEGKGDVRLLVAQCSNDFKVRAVARLSEEVTAAPSKADAQAEVEESSPSEVSGVFDLGPRAPGSDPFAGLPKVADAFAAASFRQLVGDNGRVIVTIEGGGDSGMRYQGIVPLEGDSLAECLESYFASSEQLPTRLRLAANGERTVGVLLQKLPEPGGAEVEEGSASALA